MADSSGEVNAAANESDASSFEPWRPTAGAAVCEVIEDRFLFPLEPAEIVEPCLLPENSHVSPRVRQNWQGADGVSRRQRIFR